MAEKNQVTKEPQQVTKEPQQIMKKPQRVATKDPKKVEVGKRLAAINHKKREVKKREEQVQLERTTSGVNQYYDIGAVIALGVIGGLGYYIYQSKKGPATAGQGASTIREVTMPVSQQQPPRFNCRLTSLRLIKSLLYYKNGQEECSK